MSRPGPHLCRRLLLGRRLLLVLALLAAGLPAAEAWSLQLAEADPVVRHGLIWRCRVAGEVPAERFAQGPYVLQVALTQGNEVLATQDFTLARLGQLLGGVDVVLVPTAAAASAAPVQLAVTLSDASRRDLQHLVRALPTPLGLQRGLELRQRQLKERGDQDPLPALWLEQAGELMLSGSTMATCQALALITTQLDRWMAGERDLGVLHARRDAIDGSVQPYRLHLPAGDAVPLALVALLADPAPGLAKSAWPTLPESWLAAARAAGCALVEVYPAGDAAWDGVALPRVWGTIAAAQATEARLAALPVALVGCGRGAAGAIALAEERPDAVRALGIISGRLPHGLPLPVEPHERWRALHRPGERPAHLLASTVSLSGSHDQDLLAWSHRLALAGHPQVGDGGSADDAAFWRALTVRGQVPAQQEWVLLAPAILGGVRVEELADWGLSAALTRDRQGDLRTIGIGRLRLEPPARISIDGRPYRDPGKAAAPPRKCLGQAMGPLAAYAEGAFTVVVGTGESAAAQTANRSLAQAFASAWAAHAHGRARLLDDTAVADEGPPGQHLVLIGNPRSNLLLARLAGRAALPVQWDARALTVDSNGSRVSFPRFDRRAVALAWPHPAHDGRLLVILDGQPAWRSQGLPLAGLPDLVIGGLQPEDPAALELTFGNDWR